MEKKQKTSEGECEVSPEMGHNVLFWAVSGGVRVGVWLGVGWRSWVFVCLDNVGEMGRGSGRVVSGRGSEDARVGVHVVCGGVVEGVVGVHVVCGGGSGWSVVCGGGSGWSVVCGGGSGWGVVCGGVVEGV
ncbi:hypothetical protein Pmani_029873 [Petrolisthes manimaculis]|uniref:Uncharacterized protein n=1 Tax=Petrolisthes manimaculis TaxID=1843537 RepID=A0AAE1NYK2_9EUCA|nr:hypothetical protein Pmani_029873 [Petrolisthes manimaculis]